MLSLKRKAIGDNVRKQGDEDSLFKKRKLVACGSGLGRSSLQPTPTTSSNSCKDEKVPSRFFQPGSKLLVQRAPILNGLSVPSSGLYKKFQRPMIKRRAYDKNTDVALQNSSLGQRKRLDGMTRLLARAGKGLHFKLAETAKLDTGNDTDSTCGSEEEEEDKEEDRPFEPLMVWKSPHQGGESKGLPPAM